MSAGEFERLRLLELIDGSVPDVVPVDREAMYARTFADGMQDDYADLLPPPEWAPDGPPADEAFADLSDADPADAWDDRDESGQPEGPPRPDDPTGWPDPSDIDADQPDSPTTSDPESSPDWHSHHSDRIDDGPYW